jgi:hypothetical protein
MLIDEVLAATTIDHIPESHMGIIKDKLRKAMKFDLSPDFAVAAEALSVDFGTASKAIPFCRLPFQSVWVEVAQAHRPRYITSKVHRPATQMIPKRVGFLLETSDKDHKAFKAHQFWSFSTTKTVSVSIMAMKFDPANMRDDSPMALLRPDDDPEKHPLWSSASFEARSRLLTSVAPVSADFPLDKYVEVLQLDSTQVTADLVFELSILDWSGEAMFILAFLALLNTVNAHEKVSSNLAKLNRSRVGRGSLPLQDYYTLKISSRLKSRMNIKPDSEGHRDLRLGIVRGHFKVRKTGIFFWHPYWRGKSRVGVVEKDYVLT